MSNVMPDEQAKTRIGANLQIAMGKRNVSQAELARLTGESEARISNYSRGLHMPGFAVAARIAKALDIPLESLLAKKIKIVA